jgi:PAS domain S-box-containing protein
MDPLLTTLTTCGEAFKDLSYTIVDMTRDDQPLVYVNDHFTNMTGHSREEILFKNCRFLQGESEQRAVRTQLRETLRSGKACYQDILNFKKDGTPFWNRLCLLPIQHDILGARYYVGIQLDVTQQKSESHSKSIVDFVNNPEKGESLYREIANPLEEVLSKTRALKYFSTDDENSRAIRQELVNQITTAVRSMTELVSTLEA